MDGMDHIAELERRIDAGETYKPTGHGMGLFHVGRIDPGGSLTHAHQRNSLPVSCTLPFTSERGEVVNRNGHNVRKLRCGAYATMDGRRIIDSRDAGDRHAADCGFVRTRD